MRHGEPISTYDVQFCTNIIYNEKEFVFLIVERKEGYIGHTNERMDRICAAANPWHTMMYSSVQILFTMKRSLSF